MDKLDMVQQAKELYVPKTKPELVEVPTMLYLMYDGSGKPDDNPEFQQAFSALYGIAYAIKFAGKTDTPPIGWQDFKVAPPEGLWWVDGDMPFDQAPPEMWQWTLMLRMPEFVTNELVAETADKLALKKCSGIYQQVRLDSLTEGKSVQMMHIGPYATEAADLAAMEAYAETEGYHETGKHHEIYFGDPRRTAPEKLKTVLRHPVQPDD